MDATIEEIVKEFEKRRALSSINFYCLIPVRGEAYMNIN